MVAVLGMEVQHAELKGGGTDGRVIFRAGEDLAGLLRLADTREAAPVIHFGGQFQITFTDPKKLWVGRSISLRVVVGCPGIGPGTLAFIDYEDAIPDEVHPVVEVTYATKKPGEKPVTEKYELDQRC